MKNLEQSYKRPRAGFLEFVGYYEEEGGERERERDCDSCKSRSGWGGKLMFRFKSVSPRVSFGRRGLILYLAGLSDYCQDRVRARFMLHKVSRWSIYREWIIQSERLKIRISLNINWIANVILFASVTRKETECKQGFILILSGISCSFVCFIYFSTFKCKSFPV